MHKTGAHLPQRPTCVPSFLFRCSSGASGGSNKGPAVIDKRNQVLECPHCDREFKQVQRFREHIAKHHPDVAAADSAESAAESVPGASKVHTFSTFITPLAFGCPFHFSAGHKKLTLIESLL